MRFIKKNRIAIRRDLGNNMIKIYYAAAKSLQSCPSLCDPIDGSPSGSVPGILQARTLECPPSSLWGGGPRGALGQAADWAAETSSDGGEIKETEEITGLGLTSVSTHTTDTMDNQSLPRSSGTCGPCSLGT